MLITLITYRKGKQSVHLLERPQDKKLFIMVEDRFGESQFPVKYADGRIAYDFPGRVNKGTRPLIEKAFRAKDSLEFARRNVGWHSFARDVDDVIHDLQTAQRVAIFEAGHQFMAI